MGKIALLVIDAQKIYSLTSSDLCVEGAENVILNINKLINKFHSEQNEVIYIRHMHKADGSDSGHMWDFTGEAEEIGFVEDTEDVEYIDTLELIPESKEIIKHRYSSFEGTELQNHLTKNNITRLVITGFMTNFCCESTARQAHDKDYFVDFIIDATGCPDLENLNQEKIKQATCETLENGYTVILKTDEYLNQ